MSRSPSETNETHLADGFPPAKIEQWRTLVDKALKGADFEKRLVRRTADGLKINPLYTRNDALANAADGGTRTCLSVNSAEPTRAGSNADLAGFATVSAITVARLERVAETVGGGLRVVRAQ